ncbi:MAG: BON domain-containing protein [Bryobacteraceae bacterium]
MTRRSFVFASMTLGILPAAVMAQGSADDDRIYDEVRRKLADDVDVKGGAIEVTVNKGAIVLKGRVRDNKAKEKAVRITKKVKGVTTVENQLKLFSE